MIQQRYFDSDVEGPLSPLIKAWVFDEPLPGHRWVWFGELLVARVIDRSDIDGGSPVTKYAVKASKIGRDQPVGLCGII